MRSVKDAAGFTKLKFRQEGQSSAAELKRKDLRAELEEKEQKHLKSKEEFLGQRRRHFSCIDISSIYEITFLIMCILIHAAEKEEDYKLLEAGLPGGRGAPALVPKAIDADEGEDDDDVNDSEDSSEEDEVRVCFFDSP